MCKRERAPASIGYRGNKKKLSAKRRSRFHVNTKGEANKKKPLATRRDLKSLNRKRKTVVPPIGT